MAVPAEQEEDDEDEDGEEQRRGDGDGEGLQPFVGWRGGFGFRMQLLPLLMDQHDRQNGLGTDEDSAWEDIDYTPRSSHYSITSDRDGWAKRALDMVRLRKRSKLDLARLKRLQRPDEVTKRAPALDLTRLRRAFEKRGAPLDLTRLRRADETLAGVQPASASEFDGVRRDRKLDMVRLRRAGQETPFTYH